MRIQSLQSQDPRSSDHVGTSVYLDQVPVHLSVRRVVMSVSRIVATEVVNLNGKG